MRYWLILGCTLFVIGGCGKTEKNVAVSGNVKIGANSLAHGLIRFTPETATAVSPVGTVAAQVADGKYKAFLSPGKYKVTVEATQAPPTTAGEKVPAKELPTIAAKFKTGVPTEITGPNPALDFDLSK